MATTRRLSDADVRAIFESVHNHQQPPPHLRFQIVPVSPGGLKLSPPSIEFEDGLYVLLKPQQKKSTHPNDQPKVPFHLHDQVLTDFPSETCPWSLSGPQFPVPTAIQQRYCYPRGRHEYSNRKGGALWTMYATNGKEDLEYRLLHVYFSAKRAVNKGLQIPVESKTKSSVTPPRKRAKKTTRTSSTMPQSSLVAFPVTPSIGSRNSFSFDMNNTTVSPIFSGPNHGCSVHNSDSSFVTPLSDIFGEKFHPVSFALPIPSVANYGNSPPAEPASFLHDDGKELHNVRPSPIINGTTENKRVADIDEYILPDDQIAEAIYSQASWEPFPLDADSALVDLDATWSDTLILNIDNNKEGCLGTFAARLDSLHEHMKEHIRLADETEQGRLLGVLSGWAKKVAQAPLGEVHLQASGTEAF